VLFTDADQSTPITEIEKLLPKLEREGYDMAIGSRAMPGARVEQPKSGIARCGETFRRRDEALLYPRPVRQQCGFKAMKHEVAQKVFRSHVEFGDLDLKCWWWPRERVPDRRSRGAVVHDPDTASPPTCAAQWLLAELFHINRAHKIGWALRRERIEHAAAKDRHPFSPRRSGSSLRRLSR